MIRHCDTCNHHIIPTNGLALPFKDKRVKAHGNKGANHVVWLAQRPLKKPPQAVATHSSKVYRPQAPK